MGVDIQVERILRERLPSSTKRRLVVLTGARQTGKTTLARALYPELRYLNFDAIELREVARGVRSASWAGEIGAAVLDEAQKEPGVFEKVKFAFDAGDLDFTVLLGSSRILLLEQVRESLAGRAFVYELWPLLVGELARSLAEIEAPILLAELLRDPAEQARRLRELPGALLGPEDEARRSAVAHLAAWGGMPALLPLHEADRRQWLSSYQQTYLERDLADLATLSDLLPFRTLQRLAMLRSGQLVQYASLGRDAGLSAATTRRYLEYLRLTYQAILLPPYHANLTSRAIKTPKLYWTDLGLLRDVTRQWGPAEGALFETLVVAEIVKAVSTLSLPADVFFYRTRSGLEVDLILEGPDGRVIGAEIKGRPTASRRDLGPLRRVATALGDRWAGGWVITTGDRVERLDDEHEIWAIPVHRLLG